MKINTTQPIVLFTGEEMKIENGETFTIGKAISNILLSSESGGKMKMFVLARKFYEDTEVDLDQADAQLVKTTIDQSKGFGNLITGQILVLMDTLKAESTPPPSTPDLPIPAPASSTPPTSNGKK